MFLRARALDRVIAPCPTGVTVLLTCNQHTINIITIALGEIKNLRLKTDRIRTKSAYNIDDLNNILITRKVHNWITLRTGPCAIFIQYKILIHTCKNLPS